MHTRPRPQGQGQAQGPRTERETHMCLDVHKKD